MRGSYVIAMDVHSYSLQIAVLTPGGRQRLNCSVETSIAAARKVICATPRPRRVVFEEGPLAGWLYRNLHADADEVIVAETRRNAYVAKDGDKSDAIDAVKLAQLSQAGFIRPVHHAVDDRRASFKELVMFDRQCVDARVAWANRVIWAVREHGVIIRERHFDTEADREMLFEELPRSRTLCMRVKTLLEGYDLAKEHERRVRSDLLRRARRVEMIRRFEQMPGMGWIRSSTFYAVIDTPFRFRSKSALWRYMGIGLQRRSSGSGRERVSTSPACNRPLKDIIIGAAKDAVRRRDDNPFKRQYRRCIAQGHESRIAQRTVARSLASVMWGMWKSNTAYRPDWVGVPMGELSKCHPDEHR